MSERRGVKMSRIKSLLRAIPPLDDMARLRSVGRAYDSIMSLDFAPGLEVDFAHFDIGEIEINNTCNLDCLMCRSALSRRPRRNMDLDLFEQCVVYEKQFGSGHTTLHTIGEPLLNPFLEDYFKVLRRHRVMVTLSTNGLLLAKRMDLLFSYADVIETLRLSIDGATRETYEKIRRPGKFDRLIDNLDAFSVENRGNTKIADVRVHSIVSNDVRSELAYHLWFYSKYTDMSKILLSLVSGLSPDNSYFLEESILKNHIRPWRPCDQLFQPILHVLHDGSVSVCCRDYHGELVFGNVCDSSVEELINNEAITTLRKQHLDGTIPEHAMCRQCYRVDPTVEALFELFVAQLVAKYSERWDVDRMQGRFDQFFACFGDGVPSRSAYMRLLA
jgi:MoaA/NifB/PqqE/SkfB family radical SAM enzyme